MRSAAKCISVRDALWAHLIFPGVVFCVVSLSAVVVYSNPAWAQATVLPEMVEVPGGTVIMGILNGKNWRIRVSPEHKLTLSPFRLGRHEVTFAQWDACVADGGCGGYRPDDAGWGRGRRPVINVSWDDAQAYIRWLNAVTGDTYRLPTEAEWEYAARSGSKMEYHFGGDDSELCSYANHADLSTDYDWRNTACSDGVGAETAEVGRYLPNKFGLHDMHGNVWEWVEDCWHRFYLGVTMGDGTRTTCEDAGQRVRRGGSWGNLPLHLRSRYRSRLPRSYRHNHVGFRLAQDM